MKFVQKFFRSFSNNIRTRGLAVLYNKLKKYNSPLEKYAEYEFLLRPPELVRGKFTSESNLSVGENIKQVEECVRVELYRKTGPAAPISLGRHADIPSLWSNKNNLIDENSEVTARAVHSIKSLYKIPIVVA